MGQFKRCSTRKDSQQDCWQRMPARLKRASRLRQQRRTLPVDEQPFLEANVPLKTYAPR